MMSSPIVAHVAAKLAHYQCLSFRPASRRWLVAFSGGLDSTALLFAVVKANQRLAQPLPIVAIHINHQLCADAYQWQHHCAQFAQSLGVDFYCTSVVVKSAGQGVEAAARQARLQALETYIQVGDGILFAHHQMDQAETVLLRLLRGSGVTGLAAMPEVRKLGAGVLLRPLLALPQDDLLFFAKTHGLSWIEDGSNQQVYYDRNFLRLQVLPLLRQRWPSVEKRLCGVSEQMQMVDQCLSDVVAQDFQRLQAESGQYGHCLDIAPFLQMQSQWRSHLFRYCCQQLGYPVPDMAQWQQIVVQFFSSDKRVGTCCVAWGGCELRCYGNKLYIMPALPVFASPSKAIVWDMAEDLYLPKVGRLCLAKVPPKQGKGIYLKRQSYQIRWRSGGERCRPQGRQHSQTLKKLLQASKLPPWWRQRLPLLYDGDQLVAVGDLWVNAGHTVAGNEDGVWVYWDLSCL